MTKRQDANVFVRRNSSYDDWKDDFPTPPWATRAFFKYVAPDLIQSCGLMFNEPACGRGFMVQVIREHKTFNARGSDLMDYGYGFKQQDYLTTKPVKCDVMLTNPPYKFANQFVLKGLDEATIGVAVLLRTIWLESTSRHDRLFKPNPPTTVAVFSRRMQAAHGKLVQKGGAMMSHSWFWWDKRKPRKPTQLTWIPPEAQRLLERPGDYDSSYLTRDVRRS